MPGSNKQSDGADREARVEDAAAAAILALVETRDAGATICPSEAARRTAGADWRAAMPAVHRAAAALSAAGAVRLCQGGVTVAEPVGAYRIGRP